MIEHLEDEARDELLASRAGEKRAYAAIDIDGRRAEVFARRGRDGLIRFGYSYCGVRLDRKTLLMLICPENACPCRAALHERWRVHRGEVVAPPARPIRAELFAGPLVEEVAVSVGGRTCVARPALFRCSTPCPLGVHAAVPMRKSGWDLFEDGRCIAGGVVPGASIKALIPMLPTLEAVQQWLSDAGPRP